MHIQHKYYMESTRYLSGLLFSTNSYFGPGASKTSIDVVIFGRGQK